MFNLFSRLILQVCLSGCCKYFTHMLQVFYLDAVYVCNVFQVFFRCFIQMFHLSFSYVASVAFGCFKNRSGIAHEMRVGSRRGREWSLRERAAWAARVRSSDTGAVERRPGDAGPHMDARNRTAAVGVWALARP
jgi:hypothetical protein